MANYTVDDIRNIVLLGHAGAGKTSLAEALLHKAGITNRLGNVDDKSSIMDADEEEKQRGHSVDSALAHISYKGKEINLIDTPGYPDFLGAAISGLIAAETAVIVVSASAGVQMNTRRLFQTAQQRGMACVIVVNKIDSDSGNLPELINTLQESFGRQCQCANLATTDGSAVVDCIKNDSGQGTFADVAETHTSLIETIIEADEKLMESYLGGEEIDAAKLSTVFTDAMVRQMIVPIVFTSARNESGIEELLDLVSQYCPSPAQGVKMKLITKKDDQETAAEIAPEAKGDLLGLAFRINSDPRTNIK